MRTVAIFRSGAFNVTESKDYFINPGCFGDDVARWMMERLKARGIETDAKPGQEDFGWYFNFQTSSGPHCCVIARRPAEDPSAGEWVLWLEHSAGLIGSLLGRRRKVSPDAVELLHQTLSGADEVADLHWHERRSFDAGDESRGAPEP